MGYIYNLMDAHVVSGFVRPPAGYEFVVKDGILEFFKEYGFKGGEYLYVEERDNQKSFDSEGKSIAKGVRFNVVLSGNNFVPRREVKQISKQLRNFLEHRRWIEGYINSEHDLVVRWGCIDLSVGDKKYNEDY